MVFNDFHQADEPELAAKWLGEALQRRLQPEVCLAHALKPREANTFRGVIMQLCQSLRKLLELWPEVHSANPPIAWWNRWCQPLFQEKSTT